MSAVAIALNRFGLGARPDEPTPADARKWLLDQMGRYLAMPAPWAAMPRTAALLETYQAQQRMVRDAGEGQKQAARQALRRDAREEYVAAVGARMTSALQAQTPFVERLVHFWSNHFAVSVDKAVVVGLAGAFEATATFHWEE